RHARGRPAAGSAQGRRLRPGDARPHYPRVSVRPAAEYPAVKEYSYWLDTLPNRESGESGESRIPNPKSRATAGESRIPNPESRATAGESRIPNPESRATGGEAQIAHADSRRDGAVVGAGPTGLFGGWDLPGAGGPVAAAARG